MAPKDCFLGVVRRRTIICCRNVKISASIPARDRNRSTTAQTMSLKRSLITDQHRPILGQPPAIRFATGTGGIRSRGRWQTAGDQITHQLASVPRLYPEISRAQTAGESQISY